MELQNNKQNFNGHSSAVAEFKFSSYFDEAVNGLEAEQPEIKLDNLSSKSWRESLPVLATSNDVREVVKFLKHKPEGLSLVEALNSEPRRVFDARKILAYEYWGIVKREGEQLKLTALGNKLADIVTSESDVFEKVIASTPVYLAAVEWISRKKLNVVTHRDITEFWNQQSDLELNQRDSKNSEAEVVSFFSICHAAELGVATVGKRGQPARLRIELWRMQEFLSRCAAPDNSDYFQPKPPVDRNPAVSPRAENQKNAPVVSRVYISSGQTDETIRNLCDALELADFESIVSAASAQEVYLQLPRLKAMQLCQAAVIVIGDEDCQINADGRTDIKNERLTEIVVAVALFDRRVIIIWNSLILPPENLRQYNLRLLVDTARDFRISYQAVKLLKSMKSEAGD